MSETVALELIHDPTVNYALQQNDVPIVKQLRITNSGNECLKDLLVYIQVEPGFAHPWEGRVTSLEPPMPSGMCLYSFHQSFWQNSPSA